MHNVRFILFRLVTLSAAGLVLFVFFLTSSMEKETAAGLVGEFSGYDAEAVQLRILIARYHPQGRMWRPDLRVERMRIRKQKTIFGLSPILYSPAFYINPQTAPTNTECITSGKDTLLSVGLHPMHALPESLVVHVYGSNDTVLYLLTERFDQHIHEIASGSLWNHFRLK